MVLTNARSANGSPAALAARVLAYATFNQKPDINYLIAASATPMQDYSATWEAEGTKARNQSERPQL